MSTSKVKPSISETKNLEQAYSAIKYNVCCVVSQCSSNSESTPNKLFICVPHEVEMRKRWLKLARLKDEEKLYVSPIFFCENHFNLPNDMENYMQYKVLGTMENAIMKPNCLPSRFDCQAEKPQDVHEEKILYSEDDDHSLNDVKAKQIKENVKQANRVRKKNISNFVFEKKKYHYPIHIMNDDDDSSNDVEAVENVAQDCNFLDLNEERPIMLLFGQLIGNDNKQNTVLTNLQIIKILQIEFDINIEGMHELELDIYLTVTKKYLKDWPQWDDFDRIVNGLKNIGAYESIKKILDKKYKHLKEYLKVMLDETQKQTETVMSEVLPEEKDDDDVVMEICCTRSQLNQLVFQTPCADMNNSIFNVTYPVPSQIIFNTFNIETILNWFSIKININLHVLNYRRETVHTVKRMLVNKKRKTNVIIQKELPQELLYKLGNKSSKCEKNKIVKLLDRILLQYINNIEVYYLIETVFNLLKNDLKEGPNELFVPATYRKYSSKYKYKRFLNNADPVSFSRISDKVKYDLRLEETLSPMHEYYIGKVDTLNSLLPPFSDWFNIECVQCKLKFSGGKLLDSFKLHFNDHHLKEPDWTCMNCDKSFAMADLAEKNWCHTCLT